MITLITFILIFFLISVVESLIKDVDELKAKLNEQSQRKD